MKKKKLESLRLNKKSISNLKSSIIGGKISRRRITACYCDDDHTPIGSGDVYVTISCAAGAQCG